MGLCRERKAPKNPFLSEFLQPFFQTSKIDSRLPGWLPQVATLVLPALNEMFDLTASRYAAARFHASLMIFWFLIFLSLVASLLVGYVMASAKLHNWLHMILFALLISLTLYAIFDFEYPRHGIIQMGNADHLYIELRETMQ
jgi:hypothetical protein